MDKSQNSDLHLVERTEQNLSLVGASAVISRCLLAQQTNIALRQSVALRVRHYATTCRARHMGDGNRLKTVATRLSCCLKPMQAGCRNLFLIHSLGGHICSSNNCVVHFSCSLKRQ